MGEKRKSLLKGEMVFNLCLFAFILYFFFASLTYKAYTRMIPLIVVVAAIGIMVYILYKTVKAKTGSDFAITRYAEVFMWTMLCPTILYILGFLWGAPLYCFLFLKVRGKEKWLTSISFSALTFLFFYGVDYGLNMHLHQGILF